MSPEERERLKKERSFSYGVYLTAQAEYLRDSGWVPVVALSPGTKAPIVGAPVKWRCPRTGDIRSAMRAAAEQEMFDNDVFHRD